MKEENPPATLPRFEAFSQSSSGLRKDAQLKVHLARLQQEAQEKARELELQHTAAQPVVSTPA